MLPAVATTSCTSCDTVSPLYAPADGVNLGTAISSTYGDGSGWVGTLCQTNVSVAGLPTADLMFACINTNNEFFDNSECEFETGLSNSQGILGFSPNAQSPAQLFFDQIRAAAGLANVFTIQLCALAGRLWLGGYDTNFMSGSITYLPSDQENYYYLVTATSLNVGNTAIGTDFGQTLVDSGTTEIVLLSTMYNTFVSTLTKLPNWTKIFPKDFFTSGDCYSQSQYSRQQIDTMLPQMNLTIGTTSFISNATSSYILFEYALNGDQITGLYCPGIDTNTDFTILGYAWMNAWTVVFDRAASTVGVAPTKNCDFFWEPAACVCSVPCGGGTANCYVCVDATLQTVANSQCSNLPQPADNNQPCNTQSCSTGTTAKPSGSGVSSAGGTTEAGGTVSTTEAAEHNFAPKLQVSIIVFLWALLVLLR